MSGPAGAGKSALARTLLSELSGDGVIVDFQAIYAALLLLLRDDDGRYPERDATQSHLLALAEYARRAIITGAIQQEIEIIATNSDGSPTRRNFLLTELGAVATEQVIDPGRDVVSERLAVNGILSPQCNEAINRWYGRL